jgi:hypothetical protein
MRGDPDVGGFHTWVYQGSNDCTSIAGQRAGAVHATNPTLLAGYGTFASWYILPGPNLRPENDASYEFTLTEGLVIWPWLDGGAALHSKFMTYGKITGENLINDPDNNFDRSMTWSYALDGSALVTDLAQAEVAGITVGVPPDAIKYTWMQARLKMNTDNTLISPVFRGGTIGSTPNPPRRRMWRGVLDISGIPAGLRGGQGKEDEEVLREHLFNSSSARVLLYDRWGTRWVAKMHDVQQASLIENPNMDDDKIHVELFEMGESGYLSTWYGTGSKFLMPDLPGGAAGINEDTEPFAGESATFKPRDIDDHVRWASGDQTHTAIIFPDITIPPGATIVTAYVQLRLFSVVPGTLDVDMYMEDADMGVIPTGSIDADAKVLTTATARYTQEVTGADPWTVWFKHTDISAVLQEIVDRGGWAQGNNMLYIGRQRAITGNVWSRWFGTHEWAAVTDENTPEMYVEWTV